MSTKAEQLEWHRSKVVEMRARGLSYAEIARELQARTYLAIIDMTLSLSIWILITRAVDSDCFKWKLVMKR